MIIDKNISALAGLLNTGTIPGAAAAAPEREKSQFWANTQVLLPYTDPMTGEERQEWFTAFGSALDNLKERTLTGTPKTAESHMYHSMVATQNFFTTEGKKIAAGLQPGEQVVIAEQANIRLVIQRANAAAAPTAPMGGGVKLPTLVAAVPSK